MASLDALKWALRDNAGPSSPSQKLSHLQYSAGFDVLKRGSAQIYDEFVIPQLSELLASMSESRVSMSILEIEPGPETVLTYLLECLRAKISTYTAYEPNKEYAATLEASLSPTERTASLPCLEKPADVRRFPFHLHINTNKDGHDSGASFDAVLFIHSMYGMEPKRKYIEQALGLLARGQEGGIIVVFHRWGPINFDGLVCHRTASFSSGITLVADNDEALDSFSPFVAGFTMKDAEVDKSIKTKWRKVCRTLARREDTRPGHLQFSSPNIVVAFTQHAASLPALTAHVPPAPGDQTIKNREARLHRPASIVRPSDIQHVQQCVRWALKHGAALTVLGGGHSGHCRWPVVVAVDMCAFNDIHVVPDMELGANAGLLIIAGAGCKTGDILSKAMEAGLAVPLGSHPSVGVGLWLQGGIGHLARLHGLSCDAIVGAVVVSVATGEILCVGRVPEDHEPPDAVHPENGHHLLWAIKGAGTNFTIVISVVFQAFPAPLFAVRNWIVPLRDRIDAQHQLHNFDSLVARDLPRDCSADAYIFSDNGQLHLGITTFECSTTGTFLNTPTAANTLWGQTGNLEIMDGVDVFRAEMYISGMHGGHGDGKTSSFK